MKLNEAIKSYSVFLDDIRDPKKKYDYIARSSKEAIMIVKKIKIVPSHISFDHDLGEDDTAMKFINWLIDAVLDNDIEYRPIDFNVHSANPIGSKNIEGKMNGFIKHMRSLQ